MVAVTAPRQPTAEECGSYAEVDGGRAFWWPQMGGYVARAVARVDKCHVEVWVWHDGQFPFSGDCTSCGWTREPVHIHMDDGFEWVALGTFLNRLQDDAEPEPERPPRPRGGRLPDPGMGVLCGRCGEPREAHGGPKHLGACPDQSGFDGEAVLDRVGRPA